MTTDPLVSLLLVSGASAAASYVLSTRLPRGLAALLLLLLSTYLFIASPTLVDGVLAIQSFTCILGSSAFKIAALALGRGVLARELAAGCSLWRYMGVCMLPVIPTNTGTPSTPASNTGAVVAKLQKSMIKLVGFTLATLAGMWALYGPPRMNADDSPSLSSASLQDRVIAAHGYVNPAMLVWFTNHLFKPFLFYCSGLTLWLEVEGMGDLTDALALALFGITAEPHFRTPVAATTVGEYWGKRWNITMSSMLRELVYLPIMESRLHAEHGALLSHSPSGSSEHQHNCTEELKGKHSREGEGKGEGKGEHGRDDISPAISGEVNSNGSGGLSPSKRAAHRSDSAGSLRGSLSGSGTDSNNGTCATSGHHHTGKSRSNSCKMVATAATFLASGLWHELVFYQMSGGHFSYGYWTAFFLVQVPVIMLETMLLKYASNAGFKEPRWFAMFRVNTTIAVLVTLFWAPPLMWPLPQPGTPPQQWHSVFQSIMNEGHRDLQKVLKQQVLAASSLQQVVASMEATPLWVKQMAGRFSKVSA